MTTNPHDALFKASFGQPDIARSELELVLPPQVRAHLDLATLDVRAGSFVDEELRHAHTDLLYAVRTKEGPEALVYVVFEHQSSFDATMPLRLLRYMLRVWDRWLGDHPHTKTLPVVLPVLLHHGPTGWQAAPTFASMLDASPDLLEAVRPYQPLFEFVLDDLAALSPSALFARQLDALPRLVQLALWASRSFQRLRDAAPFMRAIAATLARDDRTRALLTQLYVYLLRAAQPEVEVADVRTILLDVAGPQGREDVVNAADQLIEQGEQRALRAAIATALEARGLPLSEMGRARIAGCRDVAMLARWHARAVTAGSEAEIFAAGESH